MGKEVHLGINDLVNLLRSVPKIKGARYTGIYIDGVQYMLRGNYEDNTVEFCVGGEVIFTVPQTKD